MTRQVLNAFAVTIAFTAGATITALVLVIKPVQLYLGMAAIAPEAMFHAGLTYVGIAALAGLATDGLRLLAAAFWHEGGQVRRDIEDLFRDSLA